MQQCRKVILRHSRPLRLTFPYGFGKLDHLAIGETLNEGRYLIERLGGSWSRVASALIAAVRWFCMSSLIAGL